MQLIGTRHKEVAHTGVGGALPNRRHTTDELQRVPELALRSGPHGRYLVTAVQHLANTSQGMSLSGETTVTAAHYSDKAAHRKAIMGEEVPEPWTFQLRLLKAELQRRQARGLSLGVWGTVARLCKAELLGLGNCLPARRGGATRGPRAGRLPWRCVALTVFLNQSVDIAVHAMSQCLKHRVSLPARLEWEGICD